MTGKFHLHPSQSPVITQALAQQALAATQEIANAKIQAQKELAAQSAALAVELAGKILKQELNPQSHQKLIDHHIYTIKVNKGIRLGLCSVPYATVDGLAGKIKELM